MIIGIGVGAIFVTALTIHVIRTSKWTSKTKKVTGVFRKQNNFKISENYDDHDITLSKALSSFETKNTDLEEKLIFVRKIDNGNLEIFTCNDGNIESIGTVIRDGNKSIVTINDNNVLQNANIVITDSTRFKKVTKPKERITGTILKTTSEKVISEEKIMNCSDLFSELEVDIDNRADQETFSGKVKKLEKADQTRK